MICFDRSPRLLRCLQASAIVLAAIVACSASARCEVSVQGTVAAVRVDAQQARLPEVLSALSTTLGVRYDSLIALDEVIVAGTYSGTLEDVLMRVLTGLNYVIKTGDGAVEVIIVGRPGQPPAPITREPPLPANTNPAAQWRRSAVKNP